MADGSFAGDVVGLFVRAGVCQEWELQVPPLHSPSPQKPGSQQPLVFPPFPPEEDDGLACGRLSRVLDAGGPRRGRSPVC